MNNQIGIAATPLEPALARVYNKTKNMVDQAASLESAICNTNDQLFGSAPATPGPPKDAPRVVPNGAVGNILEQLEFLQATLNRIGDAIHRNSQVV